MPAQPSILHFLAVGLGGFTGACIRFFIENLGYFHHDKYLYTLLINITGCFLIGVVWVLLSSISARIWWFNFLITGVIGGYTTYSSFSLDFVELLRQERWNEAAFYASATIICTLAACILGFFLTSKIVKFFQ